MKRRVFSKTTPFHTFKKKKGKREGAERCHFERHCSSFFFPPKHCSGEEGKKELLFEFFSGPSLAWSPPTEHTSRPPTAHLPENRGGGPNLGSRAQWPTSRLLPIRAVKSHALGSINRTQERWGKGEEKKGRKPEKRRKGERDPKKRETERRENKKTEKRKKTDREKRGKGRKKEDRNIGRGRKSWKFEENKPRGLSRENTKKQSAAAAAWSRRPWAQTPPPASATAPPETQQATATPAPGNSSTLSFSYLFFSSLHAERIAFCMQGWGENKSPRPFWLLGQADPGPALPSGPGPAQPCLLGRVRPRREYYFGPRSAQSNWAEIGPILLGCVRPSPI